MKQPKVQLPLPTVLPTPVVAGPRYRYFSNPPSVVTLRAGDLLPVIPQEAWIIGGNGDQTLEIPADEALKGPTPKIALSRLAEIAPDCFTTKSLPEGTMVTLPVARLALAYRLVTGQELIEDVPPYVPPTEDFPEPALAEDASFAPPVDFALETPEPPGTPTWNAPLSEETSFAPPAFEETPVENTLPPEPLPAPSFPETPAEPSLTPPPKPTPTPGGLPQSRRAMSILPMFRRKTAAPDAPVVPPEPTSPKPQLRRPRVELPPPKIFIAPPEPLKEEEPYAPPADYQPQPPEPPPIESYEPVAPTPEAPEPETGADFPYAVELPEPILPEAREIPPEVEEPAYPTPPAPVAYAPEPEPIPAPLPAPVIPPLPPKPRAVFAPKPTLAPAPQPAVSALPETTQEGLQSLFLTEDRLTLEQVVRLSGEMPGVSSCVLTQGDTVIGSHNVPDSIDLVSLSAHALEMLRGMRESVAKMGVGAIPAVTIHSAKGPITFFAEEDLCLLVLHKDRGFVPGVREKLQQVVAELSRAGLPKPVGRTLPTTLEG